MRSLAILLILTSPLAAGVPDFITYSGRITDGSYDGLSAQATITFRLFDAAGGGTMLWEHEETVVVQDGYFSVMLGEGVADGQPKNITSVFAEYSETWMELEVGGQVLAREAVGSVPYAVRAEITTLGEEMLLQFEMSTAAAICSSIKNSSGSAAAVRARAPDDTGVSICENYSPANIGNHCWGVLGTTIIYDEQLQIFGNGGSCQNTAGANYVHFYACCDQP